MTEAFVKKPSGEVPLMEEIYEANAEYDDIITAERVAELDAAIAEFANRVKNQGAPVLDIGAGTGRLTCRLAELIETCEVFAIEPTRSLRAVLASRISDNERLTGQITVLPQSLADAAPMLPEQLGGAIGFGLLPHLEKSERYNMLRLIVERLTPNGSALFEVMPPWTNEPVARMSVADRTQGRHRIECFMEACPVGETQLRWTVTYRRSDQHGTVVHEATADSMCWVTTPAAFEAQARSVGLDVAWPAPELALLSRTTSR